MVVRTPRATCASFSTTSLQGFAGQDKSVLLRIMESNKRKLAVKGLQGPSRESDRAAVKEQTVDPTTFGRVPEKNGAWQVPPGTQVIDITEEESQRISFFIRSADHRLAALAPDHPDALVEPKNLVSIRSRDLTGEVLCRTDVLHAQNV